MFVQVLTLAGELLGNAEVLLRDGLHTSEIADGYQRAADKVSLGPPQHYGTVRHSRPAVELVDKIDGALGLTTHCVVD